MQPGRIIHFILAANNLSSQTRITVEFANCLVRKGFNVMVSVPYFNFLDFVLWRLQREELNARNRLSIVFQQFSWLSYPLLKSIFLKRRWFGETAHPLDPRVRVNRYWFVPLARNMPDADVMIVFQGYLVPHLLYLPPSKGKILGSIRLDYVSGMNDPDKLVSEWWKFCAGVYQRLNIPFFAISERAKDSARKLGIPVETVIHNGVNCGEFVDGHRRGDQDPLRITLFCSDHPQKGQDFGCAVIRTVKRESYGRRIQVCAVGWRVKQEHRGLFDENYGYLTGRDYVKMYQGTDIFVFPSLYDGFPAVPLEAMACGCALVTTRVPGPDEYGIHEKNCMISMPHDVDAMVQNIRMLIHDTSLRDTIRENGIATAHACSWERATDRLVEFIDRHLHHDSR